MIFESCMIVDDSEADQFYAKLIIESFDPTITIYQAYDGREALTKLSKLDSQPDLIFLDINMPGMNGHEFLKEYDTWENKSAVVVMLTSSSQEIDVKRSKAYNCVKRYLNKPLNKELLESLKNME